MRFHAAARPSGRARGPPAVPPRHAVMCAHVAARPPRRARDPPGALLRHIARRVHPSARPAARSPGRARGRPVVQPRRAVVRVHAQAPRGEAGVDRCTFVMHPPMLQDLPSAPDQQGVGPRLCRSRPTLRVQGTGARGHRRTIEVRRDRQGVNRVATRGGTWVASRPPEPTNPRCPR
jgi:hypothetical protein